MSLSFVIVDNFILEMESIFRNQYKEVSFNDDIMTVLYLISKLYWREECYPFGVITISFFLFLFEKTLNNTNFYR